MINLSLLKNLVLIPSPSGYERYIAHSIYDYLTKNKIDNVSIDHLHNVSVVFKGKLPFTVLVDAHLDTIGFIITHISKEGFIKVNWIGGSIDTITRGREVIILKELEGKVIPAVIDIKHAHLVRDESDDVLVGKLSDISLDIGIRKHKAVSKIVSIGDPVVFTPTFNILYEDKNNTYLYGSGFDDKVGCYILIETIKKLTKNFKPKNFPTIIFTFTSLEESTQAGILEVIKRYKPDVFIEIDVGFASDYPDVDEKEIGLFEVGKGVGIVKGVGLSNYLIDKVITIAKYNKIKFQVIADSGNTGYVSDKAPKHRVKKTMLFTIPLRNMHTPVEIISTIDIKSSIKLLYTVLSKLK